jgi:hypothetical protein
MDLTEEIQAQADADHARQPVCTWCSRPGQPYEHRGVRFDGLTACQGERLCEGCTASYLENAPVLIECRPYPGGPSAVYDLNPSTAAWSGENIPGCQGEPPVWPGCAR